MLRQLRWVGGLLVFGLVTTALAAGGPLYLPAIQRNDAPPGPSLGGCPMFPSDNAWNQDVSQLPVDANSSGYISYILRSASYLHADFGSNPTYGIPYVVVIQSDLLDALSTRLTMPLATLAFAGASTPQDQRDMDRVLLDAGTPGFAGAWLRHRSLDWAADLLPSAPAAASFLASQPLEVSP